MNLLFLIELSLYFVYKICLKKKIMSIVSSIHCNKLYNSDHRGSRLAFRFIALKKISNQIILELVIYSFVVIRQLYCLQEYLSKNEPFYISSQFSCKCMCLLLVKEGSIQKTNHELCGIILLIDTHN